MVTVVDVMNSRGRYRPGCSGECSAVADRRGSKLEGEIFQLLSFVLGGGKRDVPFPGDGRVWVDMVFEPVPGYRLAVEYDGAHWHDGKEGSDYRKNDRLLGSSFVNDVLRIREHPLECLGNLDVLVSSGSTAQEISRLVLLHLLHESPAGVGSLWEPLTMFLRSSAQPLHAWQIACQSCHHEARWLEIVDEQAPPAGRKHPFRRRPRSKPPTAELGAVG